MFRIYCGIHASGWHECREDHTAADDLDPCTHDQAVLHGVQHTYLDEWGWTVPYPGCPVQGEYADVPDELWDFTPAGESFLPVGRWPVDVDWDETDCTLTLIKAAP